MSQRAVNYDRIAEGYDRRFASSSQAGRLEALRLVAQRSESCRRAGHQRILEVGCGTGYWLGQLAPAGCRFIGLDPSAGMLGKARARSAPLTLVLGLARHLPFQARTMDLIFCVNAIHHFADQQGFITETFRLLRPGGIVAILGSDPRNPEDHWYIYDYFEGTLETDLSRFPAWETVEAWMASSGFSEVSHAVVERVSDPKRGRAVLADPFLIKTACSQLALLSEQTYAGGLDAIQKSIAGAEARGEEVVFLSNITIAMITGIKP